MEEEAPRIRSYLIAQAGKLTVPELVEKLRRDSLPVREAAAAVPPERFAERPEPEEWSAAEIFGHLIETTELSLQLVGAVLDGQPLPDRFEYGARDGVITAAEHWEAFVAGREPFYARVLQARGDEHLDVAIAHPSFGDLNWREWMLFMRVHDLDHARQMQAIAERFGAGASA
jgi:DinB superfamily